MKKLFALFALAFCGSLQAQPYAFGGFAFPETADYGASLGLGYQVNRFFSVEGAYNVLPRTEKSSSSLSGTTNTSSLRSWDGSSLSFSALGFLPIGERFAVLGRVGAHRVNADVRASDTVSDVSVFPGVTTATNRSESFWAPAIGLGVQFAFIPQARLRLIVEQLRGDSSVEPRNLNTLSISAAWSF